MTAKTEKLDFYTVLYLFQLLRKQHNRTSIKL